MKQVLSVADFATILDLVNDRLYELRLRRLSDVYYEYDVSEERRKKLEENALADLEADEHYKSLKHLKESLQNLNIEVECPDVEIKEDK